MDLMEPLRRTMRFNLRLGRKSGMPRRMAGSVFLLSLGLAGCFSADDSKRPETDRTMLVGRWRLMNADAQLYGKGGARIPDSAIGVIPPADSGTAVLEFSGDSLTQLDRQDTCLSVAKAAYRLDADSILLAENPWEEIGTRAAGLRFLLEGDVLTLEQIVTFDDPFPLPSPREGDTAYWYRTSARLERYQGPLPPGGWPANSCAVDPLSIGLNAYKGVCVNFTCDSLAARSILDGNGYASEPLAGRYRVDASGRMDSLGLSGLRINRWAPGLSRLDHLVHLDLSDAGLTGVPSEIQSGSGLHTLDLSGNELTFISAGLRKMENLKSVSVDGNRLCALDTVLKEWIRSKAPPGHDWRATQKCPPLADAGRDTTVPWGGMVRLHGSGRDNGPITEFAWKMPGKDWLAGKADTAFAAPDSESIVACSLRVRDEDGNYGYDGVNVYVSRYDLAWAARGFPSRSMGSPRLARLSDDQYLMTGTASGTFTFSGRTYNGDGAHAIFLARFDSGGLFSDVQLIGCDSDWGNPHALIADESGHAYLAGAFWESATLSGRTLRTGKQGNIFLAKYDPDGSLAWVQTHTENRQNGAKTELAVDGQGNLYAAGSFRRAENIDELNGILYKIDPAGNLVWLKEKAGASSLRGGPVGVDAAGNVVMVGTFTGSIDHPDFRLQQFDFPGQPNNSDIFLVKYSPVGTPLWSKVLGGPDSERPIGVRIGSAGEIFLISTGRGTIRAGAAAIAVESGFIAKYAPDGTFLWLKPVVWPTDLQLEGETVLVQGHKETTGPKYAYVSRFGSDGSQAFQMQFPTDAALRSQSLVTGRDGSFVMAGNFLGTLDLRSHSLGLANSSFDLYVARLRLIP